MKKITSHKSEATVLNVIFCILVVFIHGSSAFISTGDKNTTLYLLVNSIWRLSFFSVYGFVFLSGYKAFLGSEITDYLSYYKKKLKTIFIPYLLWNVIFYGTFISKEYFPFSMSDFCYYILSGTLSAPFYFVIIFMQFYFLMPLWQWIQKNLPPIPVLLVAILLSDVIAPKLLPFITDNYPDFIVFYNHLFIHYLFYWILGMYCGKNRSTMFHLLHNFKFPLFFLTMTSAIATLIMNHQTYRFDNFTQSAEPSSISLFFLLFYFPFISVKM